LQSAKLEEKDQLLLQKLLGHREEILGKIAELAERGRDTPLIRIHGDLHLGQILVARDDAYFIDFEGEPAKPLEERTAKASPLRDVAGVLRSISYVTHMAVQLFGDHRPIEDPKKMLANFETTLTNTFLDAYFSTAEGVSKDWRDPQTRMALARLFTIEKALYEVGYEAANRPGWIRVPLHGLVDTITDAGVSLQG
jgi:maltose alpha-D-glucosyltransferase/alpha-amylase